jgi:hypothetical protein
MKTYDRAQVLQVAAQLLATRGAGLDPCQTAVAEAIRLIDEVERQCPPPGKPEATPMLGNGRIDG